MSNSTVNPELKMLQKDLADCLARIDRHRDKQFADYTQRGHTRARTTTRNANIGKIQDRVVWLREEIRKVSAPQL